MITEIDALSEYNVADSMLCSLHPVNGGTWIMKQGAGAQCFCIFVFFVRHLAALATAQVHPGARL